MKINNIIKMLFLALCFVGGVNKAGAEDVAKNAASISDINNAIEALTSSDGALTITLTADISGISGSIPP